MSEAAIQVRDLVRDFGRVRALDHITFDVPRGQVFGFLGPNGAGKTTVIRTLLGVLAPTAGSVRVLGGTPTVDGERVRRQSGALLEHNGLYERLSALQNLEFFARVWRLPRSQYGPRIEELLRRFGLWERRADTVGTWSRGMKQKLAVARAVLHRPPLVFLDEPTAGLDPVASASLREDLASLAAQDGVTIFLTTHNLMEAERLCGLVGVIRKGRLMGYGTPGDLRRRVGAAAVTVTAQHVPPAALEQWNASPDRPAAEWRGGTIVLNVAPGDSPAPFVRWLVEHGADVDEVRRNDASFEEAFLDLVSPESAPDA